MPRIPATHPFVSWQISRFGVIDTSGNTAVGSAVAMSTGDVQQRC
ncbi:hypothetical protein AB5J72_49185 [Streptomyces sp. CG1]